MDCGCKTRSYLYVKDCEGCESRHLARSMQDHRRLSLTAYRKNNGDEAAEKFRARVANEYALDHPKGDQ